MKKIVALLLALVMLACCFTTFVSASDVADATATIGTAKAKRGAEVTLKIALSTKKSPKLAYTGGSIAFSELPEGITVKSGKWTIAKNTEGMNLDSFKADKLQGVFTLDDSVDLPAVDKQYGDIFTVTFTVAQNCTFGDKTIAATVVVKNGNTALKVENVSGKITVYCDHVGTGTKTGYGSDDNNHWSLCAACEGKIDSTAAAHKYDNACDADCNVCGKTRTPANHVCDENKYSSDGTNHWNVCTVCQAKVNETTHSYTAACDADCNVCGKVRTGVSNHTYNASAWTNDSSKHWNVCSECQSKVNEAKHVYDNSCDATCNVCGYERSAGHSFPTTYKTSDTEHWIECSSCKEEKAESRAAHAFTQQVATKEYLATAATCKAAATYYYSCVCGKKGTTTFTYGSVSTVHNYDSSKWETDGTNHWNVCSVCQKKLNEKAHEYDNACDNDCNVCGKTRTVGDHVYDAKVWESDELNHWHVCDECKAIVGNAAHDFDDDGVCKDCGYKSYVPGDLDGDEETTVDDATYILYSIFFPEEYPLNQSCDFDGDGEVTVDDATYLLYHVFFPEDYPLGGDK